MEIKTKYSIGDEVLFVEDGKEYKGMVCGISIHAMPWKDDIDVNIMYKIKSSMDSPFGNYIDEKDLSPI